MKINYSDHYRPKKDEIDNAYGDALFIFDTNSLLDLYRINPSVTEKALKTIEKYKHRIYITPHTDEEYHRHHYEITAEMCLTVKEIVTHLSPDPFISKLEEIIKKNSKYNCQFPSDLQKAYISKIENTIRKIREELSELQSHFNNVFTTHQLQHRISDLFNGRVLPNLPDQRIREIL
ncbi:MAG: hypothetical protein K2M16_05015 [Muribaculaceae bacterium]|nr:hypothetical protein [Muribaculaceae bacterium]